ncbi:Hint domain-containing protein [Gemmobacter denitrificans]|uniref:Hint domain-containing protein n=1 Tax=Gemmobacter denitrificans TaxID=3123040 RepID=A0ABU8BY13_9RHOB
MFLTDILRREAPLADAIAAPSLGLMPGALVETETGWAPVESLYPGQRLQVSGGGLRPLVAIWADAPASGTAIHVPGGVLDNCEDLMLGESQLVLLDTLGDPDVPDAMEVLVPAAALVGRRGITRRALPRPQPLLRLMFDEEEVFWAQSGVMLHGASVAHPETALMSADFVQLSQPRSAAFLERRLA